MADNEQWLADNFEKTIHSPSGDGSGDLTSADEEECMLRCVGASVIMHWDTLPAKLQRSLFEDASAMAELTETAELRVRVSRFLHDQFKAKGTA